jgi:hypothetical protein
MLFHCYLYDGKEKKGKEKEESVVFSSRGLAFSPASRKKIPLDGGIFFVSKRCYHGGDESRTK